MFRKKFRLISQEEYQNLRAGAEVIERDGHGDKVLRLADGTYLKLFRRKRFISSAAWYPYAHRFVNNCVHLERLGIACPKVLMTIRIRKPNRDLVMYKPLKGRTIRELEKKAPLSDNEILELLRFVSHLHDLGIYFRSLHLGNIVRTDHYFGLIDIADLKVKSKSLSKNQRLRNLRYLINSFGLEKATQIIGK